MEGPERAQPVLVCLNRIIYKSCRVIYTWKGLSEPSLFTFVLTGLFTSLLDALDMEGTERVQPVHFCLNRIVYQSCRVIYTWKGLSEPSLFTFVLTGLFTSHLGCFGHGRDGASPACLLLS